MYVNISYMDASWVLKLPLDIQSFLQMMGEFLLIIIIFSKIPLLLGDDSLLLGDDSPSVR